MLNIRLTAKICFFSFLVFAGNANATAHLRNVTITKLNINKSLGDLLFIRTSTPPTIVGCQTDGNWNLVLQLDTELDSKIFSGLLAAQASQSPVHLDGKGECSSLGIEYLDNFTINR